MPTGYDTQQEIASYHKRRHLLTKAYRAAKLAGRQAERDPRTKRFAADNYLKAAGILQQGEEEGIKVGGIDRTDEIYKKSAAKVQGRSAIADQASELLGEEYMQNSVFDGMGVQDRYTSMRNSLRDKAEITNVGAGLARDELSTERAGREMEALESEDDVLREISQLDPMSEDFEEQVTQFLPVAGVLSSARELLGMQFNKRENFTKGLDSLMESGAMAGLSEQELRDQRGVATDMLHNNNLTGVRLLDEMNRRNAAAKVTRDKITGKKSTGAAKDIQNELSQIGIEGTGKEHLTKELTKAFDLWTDAEGNVRIPAGIEGLTPENMDAFVDNVMARVRSPLLGGDVDSFVALFIEDNGIDDTSDSKVFLENLFIEAQRSMRNDDLLKGLSIAQQAQTIGPRPTNNGPKNDRQSGKALMDNARRSLISEVK